ncbi:uncharacterized protein LOC108328951 [Vigna angularis]|uniref:uncharacterized protein LOC108328951 n=1 Tax=Phaseolus angularis TaxID=3914 RepID=UPI0022B4EE0D|nr:uncharacterized protein LOC108328951 [Vigna angularis]
MDTIVSTTTESALNITASMVKRQVGYYFNYKDKFKELESYIEKLEHNKERLQHQVDSALRSGEEIENDVQHCLTLIDEKIKEYKSCINDECHAKTICSIGFFPNNFRLRYQLGRKATKMVEEIIGDELWKTSFDNVSYQELPSIDATFSNNGYESFASRNKTMEMIMKALQDSTVGMIGVYGPGGVGKTTLLKEIANKAREKKLFKIVIIANITGNPDFKKIQEQIAGMLGMKLEEESEIARVDRIRKRLKNEKENTLIILDDLWGGLDFNKLGIPCNDDASQQEVNDMSDFGSNNDISDFGSNNDISDYGYNKTEMKELSKVDLDKMKKEKLSKDYRGGKILLTSRNKQVLCNEMDVQESSIFSVGVLDEKESETLLKKVAGVKNSEFDKNATEIAKWSAGFPIALVSIGRTLKNKSLSTWEDVCQQIKRQNFTSEWGFTDFSIKLSYDHLKNEELKCIFLHCARMGNDALIMDLVKFCVGLNLLPGVHTITDARKRVKEMIQELEESSLLVKSYSIDRFNMHDIVRDVALSISSKEKHVLYMKNAILDEWPHENDFERYPAIFIHFCDINDELPESIHCPRLEVLHIDNKNESFEIPDEFFKSMVRLRVLILTGINLSCLPSSIKCLKKLRMLCLEQCTLGENLSIIGELKNLRILTFSGSNIENLPLEFGQLDKLQFLDISNCLKLRQITSNIIPRMAILEEFYIRDNLIIWEAEENMKSESASLSELRHLNQLQNLDIHIHSSSHFPQNLFFDRLNSYKIVIGEFNLFNLLKVGEFKVPDKYEEVKFLALNLKEGIDIHSEKWIKMLFKSVQCLLLGELNDVEDIFYELNVEGFPNLKHLSIVNNFGIKYIINPRERFHSLVAFPKLESMWLYKLDNLEIICANQLVRTSFRNLKVIKIQTCIKLVNLFLFSMVRLLTVLETIEVCDCDSLKEIVSKEIQTHTISDDKIEFPQLRLLTLKYLPTFIHLYNVDKIPVGAHSLQDQVFQQRNKDIVVEVEHRNTNSCLPLFNEKVSTPKLEWLELSSINIHKIWSDQCNHYFQNLLTLNVTDCGNLKYLLSFSVARSLVNLRSLSVKDCEMMEDIFRPDDEEYVDIFPKLKKMEIIYMKKLNTIWKSHIGLHSFCSLDSLIIRECHKLLLIIPGYMMKIFQSLQSLTIKNCKLVENIFDFANIPQTSDTIETNLDNILLEKLPKLVNVWKDGINAVLKYNNLQRIKIADNPNLKYLFPLFVANNLEKLEVLEVRKCWIMKEIVFSDKHSSESDINFKFPHLHTLSFIDLYDLRSFYSGIHTLEWPSLKKLDIADCSMLEGFTLEIINSQDQPITLATRKVIYNLEYMSMSLKEAEWLQKYIVNVHRMHKLEELTLYGLKNNEIFFWFLHRLPNLKRLTLELCHLKKIWALKSLISPEKIGGVVQLRELKLESMWSLEEIGFEHEVLLQRVERLSIQRCTKLKNLVSSSVTFSYLSYLEVMNCKSMRSLMTCSAAKTLVQLTTLKVCSCPMIVEIVAENKEEKVQEIEFKQLKSLQLVSLQNLSSFSTIKKCELKFPLLEKLVVSECPRMTKFSEDQNVPNLQKVHVVAGEKDKWYWEGDLNATLQKHFSDQVSFEYSKHARLVDYPERKDVRLGKSAFPDNFFGCIKKLEFGEACTRNILIPSHVLPYLKNLEELNVENCKPTQVIFDIDESELKMKGMIFRLKNLNLNKLSNLKCVWKVNSGGIVSFPNLHRVDINGCGSLVTLFPVSLARNIKKLEVLEITECEKLVEIVGKEDGMEHGTTMIFEFPCLSWLLVDNVPLLSCFYPGKHYLKCPLLYSLFVASCPKLKLFTSEFDDNQKATVIEAPIRQLQPLFSLEILASPKLTRLSLNEENVMLLRDAQLPKDLFCNLNVLRLFFEDDNNEKDSLPFDFFHRLPSLTYLMVEKFFGLREIFPYQKLQVHENVLGGLKQLFLLRLKELESIGLEHTWVQPYSEKLESLKIHFCPQLQKIVSCAVSFINLKELRVTFCDQMEYLFTLATVKSLVKLESLIVKYCESIKEIAKSEDGDDCDKILIFGRLRSIELYSLPKLLRFYSGNATLRCLCLKAVMVAKCPNMINFSLGTINMPLFSGINVSSKDSDLTFDDDLNTTIERFFHEQEFFNHSKHMILDEYLEMTGVQHIKPAISDNFFGSFKKLEFDGACKRTIVIPFHVLPYLKNLKKLHVHSSDAVKVIFDFDESEDKTKGIVSSLKTLTLNNLSNLKCVWKENLEGIVSFPNLEEVIVTGCRSLVTLLSSSLAKSLEKLTTLQMERCEKLEEIVRKEDEREHGMTLTFEFPCLTTLYLEKNALLSCFYPGKHYLECPILDALYVVYCPKLKLFSSDTGDSHKEVIEAPISPPQQPLFLVEKVSAELKDLAFSEENIMLFREAKLPKNLLCNLSRLCLCFEDDYNEKDSLPFDFFHMLPNLEHLMVEKCFGLKEIFPSQKLQVHDKVLTGLKELILFELSELESIGFEHEWVQPYSRKLELLKVDTCSEIENIVSCPVSFINLKELHVTFCEEMDYLFTFGTLKSLMKLETLIIDNCGSIKEIARNEEEDGCDEIIFGRLRSIKLEYLPKLISFYSGNATLQCPSLQTVMVTECPNMITFSKGVIKLAMFSGIQTSEDSDFTFHVDLNTSVESLLHEKDIFNYSKLMILDYYLGMYGVHHRKPIVSHNFFGSFKKLEFDAACKRTILIPSHVLPYLKNLEELNVHNSDVVQVIFGSDEIEVETKEIIFGLEKLTLKHLSNLKCVWKENLEGIVSFSNLQEVEVDDCGSLVTLFPLSLAKNLGKLETLDIRKCEKMVEIVGREDEMEHGTTIMFEFPCFTYLVLEKMPLLSCFYPGKHHLECPLLDKLYVACCPKLKLFKSSFDDDSKKGVLEAPISLLQQLLFSIQKVSPKPVGLTLNEENIKLMSDARLSEDLLCKLKYLILSFEDDNNGKDSLPFDFFHKLPNLESLRVQKFSGLKEIFPSQKLQVHNKVLARLKRLYLSELSELESIGLEHPWVQPFINLTGLSVKFCEKMEYLFTFVTLKSLVKLKTLIIKKCESIKEIVKNDDEDGCDEIVFGRLRSIKLNSLPKLVSFYSGNATLQCSYLKNVTVAECPNMKTFSQGVIKVSMFLEIQTSKDSDSIFDGDLNTTIQKLFHNQVIHQS